MSGDEVKFKSSGLTLEKKIMRVINDDPFGLLSPNFLGKMPVKTNSLIRYFLRYAFVDSLFYVYDVCKITNLYSRASGNIVEFDVIFGPAYKGISLGAVVSAALFDAFNVDVGFAYDRKEAKDHGEGGKLVGASLEGKRVLIVDDVITAGTAIRQSYDLLKSVGAVPVGVVIALDRAEIRSTDDKISAVQAVSRDLSLGVVSIVNLPQLQNFLEHSPDYSKETLQDVVDYRAKYGV